MSRKARPQDALTARTRRNRGFSLVELMVALAISLGLVAALVTLAVRNSRTTAELDQSSRQVENGRYALEMLADEISLAGYFGALAPRTAARSRPDPCSTAVGDLGWNVDPYTVPVALEGYDDDAPPPPCFANVRPGTGAVAVRRVSTQPAARATVTANEPHLQTPQCATDPAAARFVFSDRPNDFVLRTLACDAATDVSRYLSRAYYVADCDECGVDRIPTLKRLEKAGAGLVITPVAEGIEEVQFEYGFDTDADGIPDAYSTGLDGVAGAATNDWANVMAVRVWLIARTTDATPGHVDTKVYSLGLFGVRGPYRDAFKRRVYTTLVRLNNPAGLRQ